MFTVKQRFDYLGGAIENPKEHVFRIRINSESRQTWFELFAEFLEQPNINEVEAISIGWWFTDEDFWGKEKKYYYEEQALAELPEYLETVIGAYQKLRNLKFLYFPDGDWRDSPNLIRSDFPEIKLAPILMAFAKLEFVGVFGARIADLGSLRTNSLKVIEYCEPYSIEDQAYSPDSNAEFLEALKHSYLPNLVLIKLYVNPYQNFPKAVAELKQQNPFPNLRQIICPDPIKTSQDEDYWEPHFECHNFLPFEDSENWDFTQYATVRLDFTGE
jgi:hypothetical protein